MRICLLFLVASLKFHYTHSILHFAQNLESGLFGSLQLGHVFDLSIFIFFSLNLSIPYVSSNEFEDSVPK